MPRVTETARELLERALQLSPDERLRLARGLLDSVEGDDLGDFSQEWLDELAQRVDGVLAGEAGPDEDSRVVIDRLRRGRAGPTV